MIHIIIYRYKLFTCFLHICYTIQTEKQKDLSPPKQKINDSSKHKFLGTKTSPTTKRPSNLGQVVGQTKSSGKAWTKTRHGNDGKNFQDDFSYLDRFGSVVHDWVPSKHLRGGIYIICFTMYMFFVWLI